MNFENVQKIGQKIEVEDKKERENILDEKIIEISLIYAFHKLEKSPENKDFAKEIEDNTPINGFVMEPLDNYLNHVQNSVKGLFKCVRQSYQDEFNQEIDKIYEESGPDLDAIFDFIKKKRAFFDEKFNSSNKNIDAVFNAIEKKKIFLSEKLSYFDKKDSSDKSLKLKLFSNEYVNGLENGKGKIFKNLENFGFSRFDKLIELHVGDFYKKEDKTLGQELIKEDLENIARYIVNNNPKIAGVIGRSWLLDTPIAKNIGFTVTEDERPQNDLSCWLQFVDKNGEISKKRFDSFLESGKLPFNSKIGFIKTEDFLKRYLPEELRGKINLMEIDKTDEEKFLKSPEEKKNLDYKTKEVIIE